MAASLPIRVSIRDIKYNETNKKMETSFYLPKLLNQYMIRGVIA